MALIALVENASHTKIVEVCWITKSRRELSAGWCIFKGNIHLYVTQYRSLPAHTSSPIFFAARVFCLDLRGMGTKHFNMDLTQLFSVMYGAELAVEVSSTYLAKSKGLIPFADGVNVDSAKTQFRSGRDGPNDSRES